jgi:DNA-binding HxlR family transcriptional regulator
MTDRATTPKSYNQLCPLAMALDHIGDRWSMLIVRELLGGAARFGELMRALPGVATNLLTERLRRLEASGVVAKEEGDYALTPLGRELRAPLEALGAWGIQAGPIDGSRPEPLRSARSAAMGLEAMLSGGDQPAERRRLELRVDDEALTVEFGGGSAPTVRSGAPEHAGAKASTTMHALRDLPVGPTGTAFQPLDGSQVVTAEFVTCLTSGLARLAG